MNNWLKSLIVDDWREALKWATTWLSVALVTFGTLDRQTQAELLVLVFGLPVERVPAVVGGLYLIARMWAQRKAVDHANA